MAPTFTSILCHSMLPQTKTKSIHPFQLACLGISIYPYNTKHILCQGFRELYCTTECAYMLNVVYIWFVQRRSNAPTSKHPPSPHIERCVYETKRTLKKGTFGRHIHSLIYNTKIRFAICYIYIWKRMDGYINLQGECVIEWYSRLLWGMILSYIRSMYIYDNSRNNTYRCFWW